VSALTQLMHEGPRSTVNMYNHNLHLAATSVVWAVFGLHCSPGWSRWNHVRRAICPLQAVLLIEPVWNLRHTQSSSHNEYLRILELQPWASCEEVFVRLLHQQQASPASVCLVPLIVVVC